MFTRHNAEFAEVSSTLAIKGALLTLSADCHLDTPNGWVPVAQLKAGDAVATLDGDFVPLNSAGRLKPANDAMLVPAGALDNSTDVILPNDTLIGLEAPLDFDAESDHISVPLSALDGVRGIRPSDAKLHVRTLGLDTEEMVWFETALLAHARPMNDAFFQTLNFAEARTMLALSRAGQINNAVAA